MKKKIGSIIVILIIVGIIVTCGVIDYKRNHTDTSSNTNEAEEQQVIEQTVTVNSIDADKVDELRKKRASRRAGSVTKLGDIVADDTYETSGSYVGNLNEESEDATEVEEDINPLSTERSIYSPDVDWTDYNLDGNEIKYITDVVCLLLEDETGEDTYYEGYVVGTDDELANFIKQVGYWTNTDGSISLNMCLKKYDLKNYKEEVYYETVTVRWTPTELELVK